MSQSIDQVFVTEYLSDLHVAYQQRGSILRKTVFLKPNVKGSHVKFPKVGKGKAVQKTRHGVIPAMGVGFSRVEAKMENWYAADYSDALDEMMNNIEDRQALANAGAYACGRKVDEIIISQLKLTTKSVGDGTTDLDKNLVQNAIMKFNTLGVPDDGQRYAVIGSVQWEQLMNIDAFAKADYVGDKYPWLQNTENKKWRNINWIHHTGLPLNGTARSCFLYHSSGVGLGEVQGIKAEMKWVTERDAWFPKHKMSLGAVLIDDEGVVEIKCKDNGTLPSA
ncbi:phage capsid protein [Pseudodesulfovibrio pelocollis]|uniref:phage capsid protein n=1 Tax=Pseudodesulfovibrio pelocollis TaxID=3051432 RepID=UPI00255ABD7F|nr:phage capsid protein [Pseudodesulfovibrio sp. SB368]